VTLPADGAGLPGRQLLALGVGVMAISVAGVQGDGWRMAAWTTAGLATLALVLRLERTAPVRLFPPTPLAFGVSWGPGYVMVLALATATVSFTVYAPLLLARLFGTPALTAGFLVAVESVAWTLAALAFAAAPARYETALIRLGALAITVAVGALAWTMPHGPVWVLVPWTALQGTGFGMCWAFLLRRIVASVPADDRERASAAVPTMQMIGYAAGAAASGMVANALGLTEAAPDAVVRRVAFWMFAAFVPIALLGVFAAWRVVDPRPSTESEPSF
jgi:hypothetical protein